MESFTGVDLTNYNKEKLEKFMAYPGDYVLAMTGATIGKLGRICVGNAYINQRVLMFRSKKEIDKTFLYYILAGYDFTQYVLNHIDSESAQANISATTIGKFTFELPPLDTQKKIAEVLGALDDKIELNNKINNNLEQQAQALFDEYFPSVSTGEINIGKYISPKRGKNLLSKDAVSGKVPVVAGGLSPSTYHNTANTTSPVITISASGANAGYVNLWHIPVWSSDSSFIDSKMTPYVYFWFIMLKKRQKEIFDSQTGSAQPHIYPQHIEVMPISELDMERVKKYNNEITPMFNLIGRNIEENIPSRNYAHSLLSSFSSFSFCFNNCKISCSLNRINNCNCSEEILFFSINFIVSAFSTNSFCSSKSFAFCFNCSNCAYVFCNSFSIRSFVIQPPNNFLFIHKFLTH